MPMVKKPMALPKKKMTAVKPKRKKAKQTLTRFHVIVTNANGIPVDTPGWTAVLTRTGSPTLTANFDDTGVARFDTLTTLTTVSRTLRVRNADGDQVAQKFVPADIEAIVVRM